MKSAVLTTIMEMIHTRAYAEYSNHASASLLDRLINKHTPLLIGKIKEEFVVDVNFQEAAITITLSGGGTWTKAAIKDMCDQHTKAELSGDD